MKIDKTEIEERVRGVVAFQLGLEKDNIQTSASLISDLGSDSLDVIEIMMAIEDEFDLTIPECDADGLDTVQNIIDYIASKVQD